MNAAIEEIVKASITGDSRFARWLLSVLVIDQRDEEFLSTHPHPAVRLNFLRSRAKSPQELAIHMPCPILGPASEPLDARRRQIIGTILDSRWADWKEQKMMLPRRHAIYTSCPPISQKSAISIVFTKYISCDPKYIENDIHINLLETGRMSGNRISSFDSDGIMYDSPSKPNIYAPLDQGLSELDHFFNTERPNIVLAECNFTPTENTITPYHWANLKKKYGFKLFFLLSDCVDGIHDYRGWLGCCDRILVSTSTSAQIFRKSNVDIIHCPPISSRYFHPPSDHQKDIGLLFIGSGTMYRETWLDYFPTLCLNARLIIHDRHASSSPDYTTYANLFGRSKMTFNTGYRGPNIVISTVRFIESVMSGSLVIEEDRSQFEDFFIPYIHYIPVSNADQMVAYARYFMEREDWRSIICNAASDFYESYYSPQLFWNFVVSRSLL